jgi:hypothetical protein
VPLRLLERGTKEQGDGANFQKIVEAIRSSHAGVCLRISFPVLHDVDSCLFLSCFGLGFGWCASEGAT